MCLLTKEAEERLKKFRIKPLLEEEKSSLLDAVSGMLTSLILTTVEVRRMLRKHIELEFPEIAILSYQELAPDASISPLAHIKWPPEEIETQLKAEICGKESP